MEIITALDPIMEEIRHKKNRSPTEIAICAVAYLPDLCLSDESTKNYKVELSEGVIDWFYAQAEKYRAIGVFLRSEKLGYKIDTNILKQIKPYIPDGIVAEKLMNLYQGIHRRVSWCQSDYPGSNGWLRMWDCAMKAEFLIHAGDDGIAEFLGWKDFPAALERSKLDESALIRDSIERLKITKAKGRKPKSQSAKMIEGRNYPGSLELGTKILLAAKKLATRDVIFEDQFYTPYIEAFHDSEKKSRQPGSLMQVGFLRDGVLRISKKGFQIKKKGLQIKKS